MSPQEKTDRIKSLRAKAKAAGREAEREVTKIGAGKDYEACCHRAARKAHYEVYFQAAAELIGPTGYIRQVLHKEEDISSSLWEAGWIREVGLYHVLAEGRDPAEVLIEASDKLV